MTTATYQFALETAAGIGRGDGESAAAWWIRDAIGGRATGDAIPVARRAITGIMDCDPEVMEWIPAPDLSGEWADGLTPDRLAASCGVTGIGADDLDDLCTAYDAGFTEAAESAILSACHRVIA